MIMFIKTAKQQFTESVPISPVNFSAHEKSRCYEKPFPNISVAVVFFTYCVMKE